jgi:hypothetical protein
MGPKVNEIGSDCRRVRDDTFDIKKTLTCFPSREEIKVDMTDSCKLTFLSSR